MEKLQISLMQDGQIIFGHRRRGLFPMSLPLLPAEYVHPPGKTLEEHGRTNFSRKQHRGCNVMRSARQFFDFCGSRNCHNRIIRM